MARPASAVAICNLALDLLKEGSISSITSPTSNTESLCARWYDLIRQALLEAYNWNFALVSEAIPRGGTPSVSDYPDYYVFPNDYLKLRAIEDPDEPLGRKAFEIQGRNLFFDGGSETTLDVWFTKDETTVSLYPALFIKLLSEELALVLGKKLTARPSIMKDIKEDLAETRRLARAVDGQVRPPKRYESSKIVNAGLSPSSRQTVAGSYEFPDGMDE
jgi:hypothetical protein